MAIKSQDKLKKLHAVIERAKDGDEKALAVLSGVVESVVNRIALQYCCDDIFSEQIACQTRITLTRCIDRFDSKKGISFLHYLSWCLKHDLHHIVVRRNPAKRRQCTERIFIDSRMIAYN